MTHYQRGVRGNFYIRCQKSLASLIIEESIVHSHAGGVAAVVVAGADLSVVLLQHGGVAVTALGVSLVPAAPDDPLVTAHCNIWMLEAGYQLQCPTLKSVTSCKCNYTTNLSQISMSGTFLA